MKKFRDGWAEGTHTYHAIREKLRHELRHPERALDLKTKDLIGHLWVSLSRLSCQSISFQVFALISSFLHSKNFKFLHCLGLNDMLSANQHGEIFACILLLLKSQSVFVSSAFLRVIFPLLLLLSISLNQKPIVSVFRSRLETLFEWQTIFKAQSDSTRYIVTNCKKGQRALTVIPSPSCHRWLSTFQSFTNQREYLPDFVTPFRPGI